MSKSVEGTTSGFSATGRGEKFRVRWGARNPPSEKQPVCPKPTAASPVQETTAAAIRVFRMVKGLVLLGPPPHQAFIPREDPPSSGSHCTGSALRSWQPGRLTSIGRQFLKRVRESPDVQEGWTSRIQPFEGG